MTKITNQLIDRYGSEKVIAWLSGLVAPERLTLLDKVTRARRTDLTLLLDRFYDPHNNAAVCRTAEAFGLTKVHAVPGSQGAALSHTVAQGVEKWIDFDVHASTEAACDALKAEGFTLLGADVTGTPPQELPHYERICLVMGAEKPGLSDVARAKCDGFITIPMVGMVESFNVSVAAALLTYSLSHRAPTLLSEDERRTLLARYLVRTIQRPEIVLAELSSR